MDEVMHSAFADELEKIAGFLRGGRRPLAAGTFLKKEGDMVKRSKKAIFEKSAKPNIFLAGVATGAGAHHLVRKANEDRKMGKQIRIQQRGY